MHSAEKIVLVAAHPDDEIIGAGSQLARLPGLVLVHVTDGAPRNLVDARKHGFSSAADYASARRAELADALETVGAADVPCIKLGIPDQQAALSLSELTNKLHDLLLAEKPDIVLTHPYEGGHPDHDASAFAVHAAAIDTGIAVWEFASYHAGPDNSVVDGAFLTGGPPAAIEIKLDHQQRATKARALACFRTQQETLQLFRYEWERFRPAPAYDFTAPPHVGAPYYERHDHGMAGDRFRALVRAALAEGRRRS